MNKNVRTLVVDKTDIVKGSESKSLPSIGMEDLRQKSLQAFEQSDLVIGVTESGKTVLLKNRWGDSGVVVSCSDYEKFVKPNYENNKSNNSSKKDSFMGRVFKGDFWPFN